MYSSKCGLRLETTSSVAMNDLLSLYGELMYLTNLFYKVTLSFQKTVVVALCRLTD